MPAAKKKLIKKCVGCLILTFDQQILLQQRDQGCSRFSGWLATFGGRIETGETPLQALARELKEELGAKVNVKDVISFGSMIDSYDDYHEKVYLFFWYDRHHSITGCYEGKPRYYTSSIKPKSHRKIMNDAKWLLDKCSKLKLIA